MGDPGAAAEMREARRELPENSAVRVHNAMWAFLQGIEGFDTERASECLVKLFDEHYDTVEVLEVATKRDLVEDAGILPGDALRIVAAAKHYVAPQEADHSAELSPQSDAREHEVVGDVDPLQSVEHHQYVYRPPVLHVWTPDPRRCANEPPTCSAYEPPTLAAYEPPTLAAYEPPTLAAYEPPTLAAYEPPTLAAYESPTPVVVSQARPRAHSPPVMQEQKKARTVAQESWKTKEQVAVYVAALSVEVVNQSAVPKQEDAKESKLVKQAAPKHIKDVTSAVKDSKVPEQTYPIPSGITYPHTCRICNVQSLSENNCRSHYNGRKHRAKFAEVVESVKEAGTIMKKPAETQEEKKQPTQSVRLHTCGVCNVKCNSEVSIRYHFNSRNHIQHMEAAIARNDNSPTKFLHCSTCDIDLTCKKHLVTHFNGKRHAQNMKVGSESGHSSHYSELIREARVDRESGVAAMAAD